MNDINRAFDVSNGIVIDEGTFLTGGANSPLGLDLPVDTLYIQNKTDGILIWRKFSSDINDWLVVDHTERVDAIDYDIKVPSGNVYKLFNREVNCELYIDGEVYVI